MCCGHVEIRVAANLTENVTQDPPDISPAEINAVFLLIARRAREDERHAYKR